MTDKSEYYFDLKRRQSLEEFIKDLERCRESYTADQIREEFTLYDNWQIFLFPKLEEPFSNEEVERLFDRVANDFKTSPHKYRLTTRWNLVHESDSEYSYCSRFMDFNYDLGTFVARLQTSIDDECPKGVDICIHPYQGRYKFSPGKVIPGTVEGKTWIKAMIDPVIEIGKYIMMNNLHVRLDPQRGLDVTHNIPRSENTRLNPYRAIGLFFKE